MPYFPYKTLQSTNLMTSLTTYSPLAKLPKLFARGRRVVHPHWGGPDWIKDSCVESTLPLTSLSYGFPSLDR